MNISESNFLYRTAAKLFILIACIAILVAGKSVLIPLTLAIFFAFLLLPVSEKLESWRIPRAIAIIISILLLLIFIGSLIFFFISQIQSFQEDLPQLKEQLAEKANTIFSFIERKTDVTVEEQKAWMMNKAKESADSGPKFLLGFFSMTGTLIALLALIPLYIFFLTYLREKYRKFIELVARDNAEKAIEIVVKVSKVSRKYLKGLIIDVVILSILGSIGYMLLGIKHAVLFAVLAALLNIIPYIGATMGTILPVMMALITKDEFGYVIGAAGVGLVIQFIDNNFIYPYVIGSSVSLNPLTAIIVLFIGAMMWGLVGMILAIPIAGMIKVVCDNIEQLKPYGFLIGEEVDYRARRSKPSAKKK